MEYVDFDFTNDFENYDEDDYDDTPLFTREASLRLLRQGSAKSTLSMRSKRSDKEEKTKCPMFYIIGRTPRGSIYVKESKWRPSLESVHRLTHFEASLFGTTMEDTLMQLHILDVSDNQLRLLKTNYDLEDLRKAKFGVKVPKVKDGLNNIDIKSNEDECHKLFKLLNDRRLCEDVLKETYLDLSLNHRYFLLGKYIRNITNRETTYQKIKEDEANNKIKRRDLLKSVRHQRNRIKSSLYETNAFVNNLVNCIEDSVLQTETQQRYIDKWQVARTEQHLLTIQNKECGPSKAIVKYRRKCDEEHRAHVEIETLMNVQLEEILEKIENVMAKYDKDMEAIDIKIQRMRKNVEDQTEQKIQMEKMLVDHEEEMRAWLQFTEERERDRQYRLKMTNAAITVQAWWRGLLVRLELGPFKPKKKRKTAAKPEEKKKK